MIKQLRPIIASMLAVSLAAQNLWAVEVSLEENRAERGNIGYVDMQMIFHLFPQTQKAKENFEEVVRQAEDQINLRKSDLISLRAEIAQLKAERDFLAKNPIQAGQVESPSATPPPLPGTEPLPPLTNAKAGSASQKAAGITSTPASPSPASTTTTTSLPPAVSTTTASSAAAAKTLSTSTQTVSGPLPTSGPNAAQMLGIVPPAAVISSSSALVSNSTKAVSGLVPVSTQTASGMVSASTQAAAGLVSASTQTTSGIPSSVKAQSTVSNSTNTAAGSSGPMLAAAPNTTGPLPGFSVIPTTSVPSISTTTASLASAAAAAIPASNPTTVPPSKPTSIRALPGLTEAETAPVPVKPAPNSPISATLADLDKKIADKTKQLQDKEAEFKTYQAQVEKNLIDLESRRTEILLGKIYEVVQQVARDEGVSVVVDKSQILYGHKAVDLTPKILEKLKTL